MPIAVTLGAATLLLLCGPHHRVDAFNRFAGLGRLRFVSHFTRPCRRWICLLPPLTQRRASRLGPPTHGALLYGALGGCTRWKSRAD
jgi:hypothetical protein